MVVMALFGGLLLVNAALVKQNWDLKSRFSTHAARPVPISAGRMLPPLVGLDLDGQDVAVNYVEAGRRTMFLIFGPGCGVCEATVEHWRTILDHAGTSLSVVGISVVSDSAVTREFVNRHELKTLPVIMVNDPVCREAYSLGFIPQTLVVDAYGRVEKSWPGGLDGNSVRDVEDYLTGKATLKP
jgi:hypothetical protein